MSSDKIRASAHRLMRTVGRYVKARKSDMDRKCKVAFGVMCALLCALCMSKAAFSQALPEGKGKAEFVHNCTACHRADMVTRLKKTPDEWRKTVDDMAARGTDGSKEDLDNVVLYLVTNFGADKSVPPAATPPTTPPSISISPVSRNSSEIGPMTRVIKPTNNLIRLTMADGKSLVARLLSQDAHDLRIVSASGKIATYSKAELRQFMIIDTNPMLVY